MSSETQSLTPPPYQATMQAIEAEASLLPATPNLADIKGYTVKILGQISQHSRVGDIKVAEDLSLQERLYKRCKPLLPQAAGGLQTKVEAQYAKIQAVEAKKPTDKVEDLPLFQTPSPVPARDLALLSAEHEGLQDLTNHITPQLVGQGCLSGLKKLWLAKTYFEPLAREMEKTSQMLQKIEEFEQTQETLLSESIEKIWAQAEKKAHAKLDALQKKITTFIQGKAGTKLSAQDQATLHGFLEEIAQQYENLRQLKGTLTTFLPEFEPDLSSIYLRQHEVSEPLLALAAQSDLLELEEAAAKGDLCMVADGAGAAMREVKQLKVITPQDLSFMGALGLDTRKLQQTVATFLYQLNQANEPFKPRTEARKFLEKVEIIAEAIPSFDSSPTIQANLVLLGQLRVKEDQKVERALPVPPTQSPPLKLLAKQFFGRLQKAFN